MLILLGIFELNFHYSRNIIIARIYGQFDFLSFGRPHLEVALVFLFVQNHIEGDGALQPPQKGSHLILR